MALVVQAGFVSQSKSGREIVIKDATGLEADGVPTGYGVNNLPVSSIVAYHLVFSRMLTNKDLTLVLDGTNPIFPSIEEIAGGEQFSVNSGILEDNTGELNISSEAFKDGILDFNLYTEFAGQVGITITKGTNFITGGNFTEALKGDAVLVGGKIYQIDKSMNNNGGTVIYVTGFFDASYTQFQTLYRSNIKIFLTAVTDNLHSLACSRLEDDLNSRLWNNVNTGISFRVGADIAFKKEIPNYGLADEFMRTRFNLLRIFV